MDSRLLLIYGGNVLVGVVCKNKYIYLGLHSKMPRVYVSSTYVLCNSSALRVHFYVGVDSRGLAYH